MSGFFKYATVSWSSALASSQPMTSVNLLSLVSALCI